MKISKLKITLIVMALLFATIVLTNTNVFAATNAASDKTQVDLGELNRILSNTEAVQNKKTITITNTGDTTVTIVPDSLNIAEAPITLYNFNNNNTLEPGNTINVDFIVDVANTDSTIPGVYAGTFVFHAVNVENETDITAVNVDVSVTIKEIYQVTFETFGGTEIDDQLVEPNQCAVEPAAPTKNGYTFIGWCADEDCHYFYDFEHDQVFGDRTVYAHFVSNDKIISNLKINFKQPEAGVEVKDKHVVTEWGEYDTADTTPDVTPDNPNVLIDGYFVAAYPDDESWPDEFRGTFEDGKTYYMLLDCYIDFEDEPEYYFSKNLTVTINGVVDYQLEDYYGDGTFRGVYAKFVLGEEAAEEEYTLETEGAEITFTEEEGHEYTFVMIDLTKLTTEEAEALGGSQEELDEILDNVKKAVDGKGTLLGAYEIMVVDEDDQEVHEGTFKIKIKMTDEMKKYNSFKLYYINDEFEIEGDPIELSVDGDYLVGELPHLSGYALMGEIKESPKTSDDIALYAGVMIIAIIGLAFVKKH